MASGKVPTSSATLTCLCGAISLPGSYLKESHFPIESEICHCNPCRYSYGSLIPTFFEIKNPPPAPALAKLRKYQFTDVCARYFCATCGTHCFVDHPHKDNEWFCLTGIVELPPSIPNKPPNLVTINSHQYLADTLDGGMAPLFLDPQPNSIKPPTIFAAASRDPDSARDPTDVVTMAQLSLSHPSPQASHLNAKCHCKGVNLSIARADYTTNPHNVHPDKQPTNKAIRDKYAAWFCACRSCRLSTGSSITGHMYVPPAAITDATTGDSVVLGLPALNDSKVNQSAGLKTLTHYRSTESVVRSFCGNCGAYVFYCSVNQDKDGKAGDGHGVIDIAAGLLRAESGSMAREWVYWEDWVSHANEAVDQKLVEVVKEGGWKSVGLAQ
ncbi:uncharacterized protein AB675_1097 [Cyphellophora attinorum]|uniref:CENP-V/GFA domain-containing protein n=1 Tax=Cyphellophora attinorum TaxID=1664694 RepID=A0A0N1NY45_9EURO|nr:uncharacterized protein AB675_1097 [Phialophora attinorum]KPI38107.1 hypothetical protein AB675_1097 [Phialophora attinorum]